ncbi:MAG TPA: MFS transporter [Polyangiaceae bacterium]|nr:MFS transporter [Polyangiaceae bacterium]
MNVFARSRFLDVRPGEVRLFLRVFFVLGLTIAGHTLLETARDALFLARLPPKLLALVYVVVALGMLVITPLNVRLTRRAGPRNALVVSLLLTAFVSAWFRSRSPSPSTVFALYVFGTLSATLLIGQFWLLMGTLFSASQSRRLFGPLASGGVLGAIAGAGAATLLLEAMPVRALLTAAPLAYFGAALLVSKAPLESEEPAAQPEKPKTQLAPELTKMSRDPFLWRLAAIAALSVTVSLVIDYLYRAKVASTLHADQLAPFFARYQLLLNIGSLLLQLTVTSSVVQRVGVLGLALTAPAMLTMGSAVSALSGASFAVVVTLKATDSALRNSLGRVASELLWAPVENQARGRSLVDLLVTRGAQALTGAVLLGVIMSHNPSPVLLAICAAGLSLAWLGVGLGLRAPYIALFRSALRRGSVERDFTLGELDLTSLEMLVEALAKPEANEVIAAMNVLAERKREKLIPALILHHTDEAVLVRALELFGGTDRRDWLPLGERLLNHDNARVQQAAVRAFALSGVTAVLERVLNHPSPSLRAFAAVYLAQLDGKTLPENPLTWELFRDDDAQHTLKLAFIETLAAHPPPDATRILLQMAKLPALLGAVTQSLALVGDESCIAFLIGRLKYADNRLVARRGLVRLGEPAFEALKAAISDPRVERRLRIHIPRSISAFENAEAVSLSISIMLGAKDGLIRYKALRGLGHLARESSLVIPIAPIADELRRNSIEYLRLFSARTSLEQDSTISGRLAVKLVIELLDDKIQQSLDRLGRLLQIMHRGDDIRTIFSALRSGDRRQRGQAIEFLDALIRGVGRSADDVAGLLRLVVDDLPAEERARRATELVGVFANAHDTLEQLARDPDTILQDLAAHAVAAVDRPRQQESLRLLELLERPA